jgi:hypothetical protein
MPVSIFTLPDFRLFADIASEMMKDPATAAIKKKDVKALKAPETSTARIEILEALLKLFETEGLFILGNDNMDKVLRRLAIHLQRSVREANNAFLSSIRAKSEDEDDE